MPANGKVVLVWIPGEHEFNIAPIKCVLELEQLCNAGVSEIYNRLLAGTWHYNDVRETIRLGLIGAGMKPDKALDMVKRQVDAPPDDGGWFALALLATRILEASIIGVPGDNPFKKKETKPEEPPASESSDPSSTASAQQ